MVILGLGSNLGDRLENLRNTYRLLKQLSGLIIKQVSPIYVSDALMPENAAADWDMPYLNLALRCETKLEPLELLNQIKNIEWSIGRKPTARHWGPRVIDIDILAWDNRIIQHENLSVPHASLQERPFALWPLADVAPLWVFPLPGENKGKTAAQMVEAWGSRFKGEAPFHTQQIQQRIDTPQLVGIINVTPDSYSDGGQFLHADNAVKQMQHLVKSGAEIIDIGAESTSPVAGAITAEKEWERLSPVLTSIKAQQKNGVITPKISIDTRHSDVAMKALALGVDWINDVSGLDNPHMREVIANGKADCVVMHHLSIPERRDRVLPRDQDPAKIVYEWAEKRLAELEQNGISRQRIIMDPGIGFGKMAEQSLYVLNHLSLFQSLGVRLLIGHSRKTFLSLFTDQPFAERDAETMAMAIYLAQQTVDYIRVHNVEICARGLKVAAALDGFL
jgi:2-amino-4-hydroxy-6-hydroxymethyldihydropteridine diphosphokinase/dihydropteroate synthase